MLVNMPKKVPVLIVFIMMKITNIFMNILMPPVNLVKINNSENNFHFLRSHLEYTLFNNTCYNGCNNITKFYNFSHNFAHIPIRGSNFVRLNSTKNIKMGGVLAYVLHTWSGGVLAYVPKIWCFVLCDKETWEGGCYGERLWPGNFVHTILLPLGS